MCGVGIGVQCGATCKTKLVYVLRCSVCARNTHTPWCKRGFNAIISSVLFLLSGFFSIISGLSFFSFASHIPFSSKYLYIFLSTPTKFQKFPLLSPFHVTYHNWDAPLS
ncbi:hypothetical protein HKD37_16G044384 [Glycine soja]